MYLVWVCFFFFSALNTYLCDFCLKTNKQKKLLTLEVGQKIKQQQHKQTQTKAIKKKKPCPHAL